MAVLVALLGAVLALMALLVAGLLRSHAEILRSLHDLGVDLDPAGDGVTTAVDAPTTRDAAGRGNGVRSSTVPQQRPSRVGVDVAGQSPDGDAISISVTGGAPLTLLAFLTSGCSTCQDFWDAFRADGAPPIPGDARLVIVAKGSDAESPSMIRRLAPVDIPVVMSTAAWDAYDTPVAPFFVLVEGETGQVIGEGAASNWDQVLSLLQSALGDAGMLDRKGRVREGARAHPQADVEREARADRELFAAGIGPGDASLWTLQPDAPVETDPVDGAEARA